MNKLIRTIAIVLICGFSLIVFAPQKESAAKEKSAKAASTKADDSKSPAVDNAAKKSADSDILGPVELDYLRSALRCIKMTPEDLLYEKNTDPGLPYRLTAVDNLMANPLDVPFYTDKLAKELSASEISLSETVKRLQKELDLPPVELKKSGKGKMISALVSAKNLPDDLKEILNDLIAGSTHSGKMVKESFAKLSDEGKKNLKEAGNTFEAFQGYENFDRPKMIAASCQMISSCENILPRLKNIKPAPGVSPKEFGLTDAQVKGDILFYAKTDAGEVIVGGSGANEYISDFSIIIDLGGNDRYSCRAGGTDGRTQPPVAICLDLGGNNEFVARLNTEKREKDESDFLKDEDYRIPFCHGAALAGIGILIVDGDGDNKFTAGSWSQGSAHLGVGILARYGKGKDTYKGLDCVQGASSFGVGLLVDNSGDDNYSATFASQGFGGPAGIGLLMDKVGNDKYYAGGRYHGYPMRPKGSFIAMSQGFGYGLRPSCSGGIGILLDNVGDDFYHLNNQFGMGGSYWFGFGMLVDDSGNDTYRTGKDGDYDGYTMGAAIHLAAACLIDRSGDDKYHGNKIGPAIGWDFSPAWLIDGAGNDLFTTSKNDWNRMASGNQNGCGFLVKKSGSAKFDGYSCPSGYPERDCGSIGILLNLGKGEYTTLLPQMTPNAWYTGHGWDTTFTWCAGIDGPVPANFSTKEILKDWPRRDLKKNPTVPLGKVKLAAKPETEKPAPVAVPSNSEAIKSALAKKDKIEDALSALKVLAERDPGDSEIHFAIAVLLAESNPAEAMKAFSEAVKYGFADVKRLESEKKLDALKKLPEYAAAEKTVREHAMTPEEMDKLWLECLKERGANWDKSTKAQEKFKALGRPALNFALQKLVGSNDNDWRWIDEVVAFNGKLAVPILLECLKSKNDRLLYSSIYMLGLIGDQRATEPLLPLLEDKRFTGLVCKVLGSLKDKKGVPALLKLSGGKDFAQYVGFRKNVAVSLGNIGDPQAIPLLVKLLDDKIFWVRYPAEQALIKIGTPSAPALLEVVKKNAFPANALALEALGRIKHPEGDSQIYEALKKETENSDWAMRGFAVEALGDRGDKSAVAFLESLKKTEKHPFVLGKISWSINRLNNPPKPAK